AGVLGAVQAVEDGQGRLAVEGDRLQVHVVPAVVGAAPPHEVAVVAVDGGGVRAAEPADGRHQQPGGGVPGGGRGQLRGLGGDVGPGDVVSGRDGGQRAQADVRRLA